MYKYLQPKNHYTDLYDEHTIDECRRTEAGFDKNKFTGKKAAANECAKKLMIYLITGERYRNKEQRIAKWMETDKAKDDKLENTPEPSPISCFYCTGEMKFDGFKHLDTREDGIERVLFFYDCTKCKKSRIFWEDGKEWESKKSYCKKCGGVQDVEFKDTKDKAITTYTCSQCKDKIKSVSKNYIIDKIDRTTPEYQKDKERFCLSDEEGWKYIKFRQDLDSLNDLMKEQDEREKNKHIYDAVAKLQKLKVSELENLLNKKLKKENYTKLKFTNTEITDTVIITFTIQDEKSGRMEYNSRKELEKLIKKTLSSTNWRLMSEGVGYRLGILSGRLKGYEREEDLIKLVKKNEKNNTTTN